MARSWSSSAVAAITVFPSIGSLLFGYDIGATSYVLNQLQSEENAGVVWRCSLASSPLLQALVPAAAVAGALVGSIIGMSKAFRGPPSKHRRGPCQARPSRLTYPTPKTVHASDAHAD